MEIEKHSKKKSLKICEFYGDDRESLNLLKFDVVLTTYNILQVEKNKNSTFFKIKWFRVILDEAHIIKSHLT